MDSKKASRRPFENMTLEDEQEEKIEINPDHGLMYLPAPQIEHGNIFDQEPVLTEEEGQMALKRLKDEGYTYGD